MGATTQGSSKTPNVFVAPYMYIQPWTNCIYVSKNKSSQGCFDKMEIIFRLYRTKCFLANFAVRFVQDLF